MQIKQELKDLIDFAPVSPSLAKQVEKTVCRYAKPKGCCDTLIYVMNRIKNMILSLIGCSDWQRTVRAIRNEQNAPVKFIRNELKEVNRVPTSPKNTEERLRIANDLIGKYEKSTKSFPKDGLTFALKVQNGQFADEKAIDAEIDNKFSAVKNLHTTLIEDAREQFTKAGMGNLFEEIIKKMGVVNLYNINCLVNSK